jgi:hypothetical protein
MVESLHQLLLEMRDAGQSLNVVKPILHFRVLDCLSTRGIGKSLNAGIRLSIDTPFFHVIFGQKPYFYYYL